MCAAPCARGTQRPLTGRPHVVISSLALPAPVSSVPFPSALATSMSGGRMRFMSTARTEPMQYGVPRNIMMAFRKPFSSSLQSAPVSSTGSRTHGQKRAEYGESRMSLKMLGFIATPTPTPSAMPRTTRLRRDCMSTLDRMARPLMNTWQKRNVVMPPITQSGMLLMMPLNLATTPRKRSQQPHATPARRDAHFVSEMTPLFCENVVLGMPVARAARNEQIPSERRPPWMDLSNSSVSIGSSEASYVAVMSPMVSSVVTRKATRHGRIAGP
mmetsp:Transcript_117481/g.332874  ORF Transcript_117481/g.332874 Transcript_117481/m.332874 type:complete len:271 (-) Transcript_117481:884-1696(-)